MSPEPSTERTSQDKADMIRAYQASCNGTLDYAWHWTKRFKMTDGVRFVAEVCGAHWLTDLIASHQCKLKVSSQEFQVWKLQTIAQSLAAKGSAPRGAELLQEAWIVVCDDGNGNIVTKQRIEYSDFPAELMPFSLWLENGVLMLPEER